MTNQRLEQLKQLLKVTWDGDLISKTDRDKLFQSDYCRKYEGFNYITDKGIRTLVDLGELKP